MAIKDDNRLAIIKVWNRIICAVAIGAMAHIVSLINQDCFFYVKIAAG